MILSQLSVSQVTSFDHTQTGGCQRRWWFERAMDLRPDEDDAQGDGSAGHALLEEYFLTGVKPAKRVKMAKAVTGAIVKGELPGHGLDLFVERRFSGQAKKDAAGEWIPLDVSKTLHIGGVPFDGYIDLSFRRGDIPEVWDHKFSSDIHLYSLRSSQLIQTVQMPVYVASLMPRWPDAKQWRIVHHNVSRKGVDSFIRAAVVSNDEVFERLASVETTIEAMKSVATAEKQDDVPSNHKGPRRACEAWTGCPHQSICSAFKERQKMSLTPEEVELFGALSEVSIEAPAEAEKPKLRMKMVDEPAPVVEPALNVEPAQIVEPVPTQTSDVAVVLPPDAPKSDPLKLSEQPKTESQTALPLADAPTNTKAPKKADAPVMTVTDTPKVVVQAPATSGFVTYPTIFSDTTSPKNPSRQALIADVLEAIAALVRAG